MTNIKAIEKNPSKAATLLKALSNEKRLAIICALYKEEKSVGELEHIIGLSQSALSQHLARLRKDNIVKTRRQAQTIYYSLDHMGSQSILECLCDICESADNQNKNFK
ncbi:MAG: metalloregulator ArsR/SmtB family transcription factor [Alphaproteobacteria bacterium]|nr:metalloregulator ArsR/SmtB family transcription factor [Alphaproteobacteria bacterium]